MSDFFKELNNKFKQIPTRRVDHIILSRAQKTLALKKKWWQDWKILVTSPLTALLVFWMYTTHENRILSQEMLSESPEMIQSIDEMEIFIEVADLSEEEWQYLETGET